MRLWWIVEPSETGRRKNARFKRDVAPLGAVNLYPCYVPVEVAVVGIVATNRYSYHRFLASEGVKYVIPL
jgi:hypothetical protein